MEFTPAIAQMSFAIYLAFFVVFLVQPGVSGLGGVTIPGLVILVVATLIWLVTLMVLVLIDAPLVAASGASPEEIEKAKSGGSVMWIVTVVVTVTFLASFIYDIHTQRKKARVAAHKGTVAAAESEATAAALKKAIEAMAAAAAAATEAAVAASATNRAWEAHWAQPFWKRALARTPSPSKK